METGSGGTRGGWPLRRVAFVVAAVIGLLVAGLLLWLHLSGGGRPCDRNEVLREEVRKQIQRRVQESLKLHVREVSP